MILNKMTVRQARDNFSDLLGSVYYGKNPVAVEKKGRVFAIVINPDEYEALKKSAKAKLFTLINETQKSNKAKDFKQSLKDITTQVEAVRAKRYAER